MTKRNIFAFDVCKTGSIRCPGATRRRAIGMRCTRDMVEQCASRRTMEKGPSVTRLRNRSRQRGCFDTRLRQDVARPSTHGEEKKKRGKRFSRFHAGGEYFFKGASSRSENKGEGSQVTLARVVGKCNSLLSVRPVSTNKNSC